MLFDFRHWCPGHLSALPEDSLSVCLKAFWICCLSSLAIIRTVGRRSAQSSTVEAQSNEQIAGTGSEIIVGGGADGDDPCTRTMFLPVPGPCLSLYQDHVPPCVRTMSLPVSGLCPSPCSDHVSPCVRTMSLSQLLWSECFE